MPTSVSDRGKQRRRVQTPKKATSPPKAAKEPTAIGHPHLLTTPDSDGRQQLVQQAAYFLSERRGFVAGQELVDWRQAEQQVDHVFEGVHFSGD